MLIAFIGGGNMATALISGLTLSAEMELNINVVDPSETARAKLRSEFDVAVFTGTASATKGADVIVLAVKPQVLPDVLTHLAGSIEPAQLVLSIAAGATVDFIAQRLGPKQAIVRCMPNTPALVGEGISALFAGEFCRSHHRQIAERVLKSVGEVVWVEEESLLDAVTAISGSGPAYFFLLAEAMADAGVRLGLGEDLSRRLAQKTCVGAGAMLNNPETTAEELRRRVTSPGGTTEAAISAFVSGNFSDLVCRAAEAAARRSRQLSSPDDGSIGS